MSYDQYNWIIEFLYFPWGKLSFWLVNNVIYVINSYLCVKVEISDVIL